MIGYKYYHRRIRPYFYAPQKKPYTFLGMTLFSLVVFGALAIRPSLAVVSGLTQEVKEARTAAEILEQKINDLSQAQINYQLTKKDLLLIEEALPTEATVPYLLERLALVAGRHNILLRHTRFEAAAADAGLGVKTLPFTVEVEGSLLDIEKFVAELEEGVRQIDFEKVEIGEGDPEGGFIIAEVELRTYYSDE